MDWHSLCESAAPFFRWKRDQHPDFVDFQLEWGLLQHLRSGLSAERGDEAARERQLAEGDACLDQLERQGCEFPDFQSWRDWSRQAGQQEIPPAELLEQAFRATLAQGQAPLAPDPLNILAPLTSLPAALRRVALCPAFGRLFAGLGEWSATRKRREEAESLFALAVLVGGQVQRHWLYRAELERSGGEVAAVEALLARGLEGHPDDVALLREMARELDRQDRTAEAIAQLERAVGLKPSWPDLRFELARLYERNEHPELSLAQFRKALDLNPGYERAALFQAELMLKLGDKDGATAELETLRERGVEPQRVYQLLSLIYAESEDPRLAARFGALAQEEGPA